MLLVDAGGLIEHANAAANVYFCQSDGHRSDGHRSDGDTLQQRSMSDVFHTVVRLNDHGLLWPKDPAAVQAAFECEVQDARQRRFVVRAMARPVRTGQAAGWTVSVQDRTMEHQADQHLDAALRLLNHDLRSPHSSILSVIELWRLRQGAMSEGDLLAQVEANAVAALAMADNFVLYVRAERTELRCEALDLNDVASEAVDDVWGRARERRVTVRRQQAATPQPRIAGDAVLLQRAMGNLLLHALGRSPGGASISCSVVGHAAGVAFEVTDHGATPVAAGALPEAPWVDRRTDRTADRTADRMTDRLEGVPVLPAEGDYAMAFAAMVAHRHGGFLRQRRAAAQGLTVSLHLPASAAASRDAGADQPDAGDSVAVAVAPDSSSASRR